MKLIRLFNFLTLSGALAVGAASNEDPELFTEKKGASPKIYANLFPPHVKTVAVIAPGSAPMKAGYKKGLEQLQKSGLKVKVGKHVFAPPAKGSKNAPVEGRLEDFYAAWNDPEVDFILCMRGGGGCEELLRNVDWKKLSPRPELYLQGYSDVTMILCAMQDKKVGRPVAGPMIGALTGLHVKCLKEMSDMHHGKTVGPVPLKTLVPGDCEGLPLVGLLERLHRCYTATDFPPETRDRIIIIENVGSSLETTRTLLYGLLDKGFFKDAAGVVFGHFVRCGDPKAIDQLLSEIAPKIGKPVYRDFPFGHTSNSYTVDFQRKALIRDGKLTFPEVKQK